MAENTAPKTTPPQTGPCGRCGQNRPLFPARPEWGDVPALLCSTDWQAYAQARATGGFVDANDAFDNATDEQLLDQLTVDDMGE